MLLELDLIPSSSFFNNVRSIVSTKQWDFIKKQVYSQAYYVCQICGGVGANHPVEAHEIWAYDEVNLIQKLTGMIALCPNCHMVKHFGLAQIQNRADKALFHFMKINKVNKKEAEKHISNAFKVWKERSKKQWKLDISILSQYGIDVSKLKVK